MKKISCLALLWLSLNQWTLGAGLVRNLSHTLDLASLTEGSEDVQNQKIDHLFDLVTLHSVDELKRSLGEHFIETLISYLPTCSDYVKQMIEEIISALVDDTEHRKSLAQNNGVDIFIVHLDSLTGDVKNDVLCFIEYATKLSDTVPEDLYQVMINSFQNILRDDDLDNKDEVVQIIGNIADDHYPLQNLLRECGLVSLIMECAHDLSQEILARTLWTLADGNEANQNHIRELGGISFLVSLFDQEYREGDFDPYYIDGALAALAEDNPENEDAIRGAFFGLENKDCVRRNLSYVEAQINGQDSFLSQISSDFEVVEQENERLRGNLGS